MPRVHAVVESPVAESFRVAQVAGMFDVERAVAQREEFEVELPGMPPEGGEDWQIGAIVGPSGSGKSTVARQAYGAQVREAGAWPREQAVLEGFDAALSAKEITAMLTRVGFSSPPAWLRPYGALSNGQRHRCDLARALLAGGELCVFDEFTSVVDRQVAQVCAACVAKTVRAGEAKCRRFVAVTCHYDVLDWLQPDWWLDMASRTLARGWVQPRPEIKLEVRSCSKAIWPMFKRHHYLSGELHAAARCYVATYAGDPVAFCASLQQAGHTQYRRITRLVVMPDWQGLGLGTRLLTVVAAHESLRARITIKTSHPSLMRSLTKRAEWRLMSLHKSSSGHHTGDLKRANGGSSHGRITGTFAYRRAA